jgi:hypothetical protein
MICGVEEDTLYVWHAKNYLDLSTKIENWKRDRKLMLAEVVIEETLTMTPFSKVKRGTDVVDLEELNPALLKIKQDTAKFVAETLGKDTYSKRSELSGLNGGPIEVNVTEEQKNKIARRIIGGGGSTTAGQR